MSAAVAGTAYVPFRGDFSNLNREVAARVNPLAKDFGGKFGKALGPVMAQQSKHLETFTRAAKYATAGGAALAAYGLKDVVVAGSKFEKQMSTNSAISEANRKQMALLEKQSLKLGKATFFSANEAGQAQEELLKGGLKIQQVLGGGLPAALTLAEAGELDLATAAETTVNAMKLFGIQGKDASSVADMFATAANRTTADVLDFAMALKQGGSVTKLAGYDMNNTVTILESLAEAGIKNSDAGTSMKAAVIQLLKPSKKQAELAKELNLHWTTQAGTLKTAVGLSKELRIATGDMTKAERAKTLATLAGTDGVRTLNALYSETPKQLRTLEIANAKQGVAQEIAKKKMDNVAGSWEQFKGSVETAEIQIYQGMAPALGTLADEATKAANNVGAVFGDPDLSGAEKIEEALDVLSGELGNIWDDNDMTEHLVDFVDRAIPVVAEHVGQLGLKAAEGFGKGFLHADPLGKAVMAAWLLNFVGGKAAFVGVGKALGKQLGFTLAAEAAATAGPAIAAETVASTGAAGGAAAAQGASLRVVETGAAGATGGAAATAGWRAALAKIGIDFTGPSPVLPITLSIGSVVATHEVAQKVKKASGGGAGIGGLAELIGTTIIGTGSPALAAYTGINELTGGGAPGPGSANTKKFGRLTNEIDKDFKNVMTDLSVDAVAGLGAVNRDLARGLSTAGDIWSKGTRPWRAHTAEAMEGAVAAIESGIHNGTISTEQGKKEINHLLAQIHLVKGNDPFGLAKATTDSFKQSNGITAAGVKSWMNKLDQMPVAARKSSIDATEHMLQAWAQGHPKIERQIDSLTAYQIRKFGATNQQLREGVLQNATGPVAKAFQELASGVGGALENIGTNTSQLLRVLGMKSIGEFKVTQIGNGKEFTNGPEAAKALHHHHRQAGGFIVPGIGSGDTFRTMLPPGSFILNREATAAFLGRQGGGTVPVALEPKEAAFLPNGVRAMGGAGVLQAMNQAVPRHLQKGGALGHPQIGGGLPGLRGLGQKAIDDTWSVASKVIAAAHARQGLGAMNASGSVGSHPELQPAISAIVATILKRFPGLAITSTTGGGHATNSLHYEGRAADLAAISSYMLNAAGWIKKQLGANLTEGIHNPNLSIKYGKEVDPSFWTAPVWADHLDHIHVGKQLGGLVKALSVGGPVPPSTGELVGASYYGGPTDGVSGTVGAAGVSLPGKMSFAELAMGKALGGLDFHTKLKIGYNGKSVIAEKLDIGAGGDDVGGHNRAIDLWYETANAIGMPGTGVVKVSPAGGKAASDEHSFKEDVPAIYYGCRTHSLDFPSMPKSLKGVEAEIDKRHAEVGRYRRVAKKAERENRPGVAQALKKNVTALETRLTQLRREQHKLRFEKAKKGLTKGLKSKLGKVAGYEVDIAQVERAFNISNQNAEQIVGLEPQQPELPSSATDLQREAAEKDYVARLSDYVNSRERPAYGDVLAKAADWRNTILKAEYFGFGKGKPSVADMEFGWEKKDREVVATIDHINDFSKDVGDRIAKWQADHPKEKTKYPDWLKKQIKERDELREKLPWLRFQDSELRKAVGEGREWFFPGGKNRITPPALPLEGSGSLEDALSNVQGIHWPDSHGLLPASALVPPRIPGRFGGAIWDVQTSIEELGLKISQASNSLGSGGGGGEDDSESKSILEELLRQANQRNLLRGIEERVAAGMPKVGEGFQRGGSVGILPPFGGVAHQGAIVPGPPGAERTMVTMSGEGILPERKLRAVQEITDAAMGRGGVSSGDVSVEIHGDIVSSHPDPVQVLVGDKRFAAEIRKVTDRDGRRETRGAGRGLARAGVFGHGR